MNLLKQYRFVALCMLVVVGVGISDLCAWKETPFVWREWWWSLSAVLAAAGGFVFMYKRDEWGGDSADPFVAYSLVCRLCAVL